MPAVPPSFIPTGSRRTLSGRVRPGMRRSSGTCTSISAAGALTRWLLARHQRHVAAVLANSRSVAADVTAALQPPASRARRTQRGGPEHLRSRRTGRRSRSPRGPATAGASRRAHWPGGDIRALERTRGVSARARRDVRTTNRFAATSLAARCTTRPAASTRWTSYRTLADRLGLNGRVGFTGFLPPAPAMRALDVVVHASTQARAVRPRHRRGDGVRAGGDDERHWRRRGAGRRRRGRRDPYGWRRRQPVGMHGSAGARS